MIAVPIANNSVPMLHEIVWLPGEWYITAFLIAGMIAFGAFASCCVVMGIASFKLAALLTADGLALFFLSLFIIVYNKYSISSLLLFLPMIALASIFIITFLLPNANLEGDKKHE